MPFLVLPSGTHHSANDAAAVRPLPGQAAVDPSAIIAYREMPGTFAHEFVTLPPHVIITMHGGEVYYVPGTLESVLGFLFQGQPLVA